jgi:parvulin-like peptidyl-prolyl isomerase
VLLAICSNTAVEQPGNSQYSQANSEIKSIEQTTAGPAYTNEIAAIVNGHIITMERVRMDVAPILERLQMESNSEEDFRKRLLAAELEVVNNVINRKLIVDAFFERGGKFSNSYEEKEYENYLKSISAGDRLKFSKFLKEYGKSVREFKKDVKERAIVQFMFHELRASQIEVSPAKIKEYYDAHMSEFFREDEVELKQIVIYNSDNTEEKLQLIYEELSNGHDFREVAKKYSESMDSYDMGYVIHSDLIEEVSQAIENVEIGNYSGKVVFGNATHVFFVSAGKPAKQLTLKEASQGIENKLFRQYQEEAHNRWIQKLRDKAYIKIYIGD